MGISLQYFLSIPILPNDRIFTELHIRDLRGLKFLRNEKRNDIYAGIDLMRGRNAPAITSYMSFISLP